MENNNVNIPNPPVGEGPSVELARVVETHIETLNRWKELIQKLGIPVVIATKDPIIIPDPGGEIYIKGIWSEEIPTSVEQYEIYDKSIVLFGSLYILTSQFIAQKYWPDSCENTPPHLTFELYATGSGSLISWRRDQPGDYLVDTSKYLGDNQHFQGTWQQIYEKLIDITTEMVKNFKLPQVLNDENSVLM